MEKKTARNVTDAEHSPIGRVQVGTDCSNLDGKGAGVATRPMYAKDKDISEVYTRPGFFGLILYPCLQNGEDALVFMRDYVKHHGNSFTFNDIANHMKLTPRSGIDLMEAFCILMKLEKIDYVNNHKESVSAFMLIE